MKGYKLFPILWGMTLLIVCLVSLDAAALRVKSKDTKKIRVVSTVYPLMEFSQAVLANRGDVSLLLPPGVEIHSWRPRPSDIRRISQSDLFICIGAGLEPWITDILNTVKRSDLHVFQASEGISLLRSEAQAPQHEDKLEHDHDHNQNFGHLDPHIWMDFGIDQVIIDRLVAKMSELMPEASAYFKSNGEKYKERLRELDKLFEQTLSRCQQKTFILGGHAAFGYLAKRYHLHQISLFGLSPDSTPTPRAMTEVVELAKKHNIKVIYFEINVSDNLAKVIAQEIGARTLVLNPAANITLNQRQNGTTFFDIMNMNLKNLREGLDCE